MGVGPIGGGLVPEPNEGFGGNNVARGIKIKDSLGFASLEGVKFSFQNKENIRTLIDSYGILAREKRDAITFLLAEVKVISEYFADPLFTPSDQAAINHYNNIDQLYGGQIAVVNGLNAQGEYGDANAEAANFNFPSRLWILEQALQQPVSNSDNTGTVVPGDAFPDFRTTYLNLVASAPQPPPTPNPGGTPNPIPPHPEARDYSAAHAYLASIGPHIESLRNPHLNDLFIHNGFIDRRNAIEPQQKLIERLVLTINRDRLFDERIESIGETSSRFAVEKTQGTLEAEGVEDARVLEDDQGGGGAAAIGLMGLGNDLSHEVGVIADQALLKEQIFYSGDSENPIFAGQSTGIDTSTEDSSSVVVRDPQSMDVRDKRARMLDKAKAKIEAGKVIQGLTSDQLRAVRKLAKGDKNLEMAVVEGFAQLPEEERREVLKTLLGDVAFSVGILDREVTKRGTGKDMFGQFLAIGHVRGVLGQANDAHDRTDFLANVEIKATDQQQADLLVKLTGIPAETAAAVIGGQAKADLGGKESQDTGGHTSGEYEEARARGLDDDESPASQEIEENLEAATLRRRRSLLKQLPADIQAAEVLLGDVLAGQNLIQDTTQVLAQALKQSVVQAQQAVQDAKPPIRPNTVEAELTARETLANELRKLSLDPTGSDVIKETVLDRIEGNQQLMKAIGDQALQRVEQQNAELAKTQSARAESDQAVRSEAVASAEVAKQATLAEQDRANALATLAAKNPNEKVTEEALKAELVKIEAGRLIGAVAAALIDQVRALTLSVANRVIEDGLALGKKQVQENEEDVALGTVLDKENTATKDLVARLELLNVEVDTLKASVTEELEVVHLDRVTENFDVFMEKHEEVDKFLANFIDPGVNIVEGWAMTNETPQDGRPELHFEA